MQLPIERVDPSWDPLFVEQQAALIEIFQSLVSVRHTPPRERIFRAFEYPLEDVRVVIFGQDPYPSPGVADGLAFSSLPDQRIPASLRNVFKELHDDLGVPSPETPDLTAWSRSGVMLLNRTLTTAEGERNAHLMNGWRSFTDAAANLLAAQNVVAILWGNNARELAPLFKNRIESAHPSPLSAHRGFFGSRPFSTANRLLQESGRDPINWSI
jgi:uracil-DNA glycosylase